MTVAETGTIVAVPAEHPRLGAVLRAHAHVQRVQAARRACLYLTALGGGLAWIEEFWPRAVPPWSEEIVQFGWPICFGFLILLFALEWRGKSRLAWLLRDEEAGPD